MFGERGHAGLSKPSRVWIVVALGLGIALGLGPLFGGGSGGRAEAQELTGRFQLDLDLEPLLDFLLADPDTGETAPFPAGAEELPLLWGVTAQLDLNLKYPVVGTDNTFVFTRLGLALAWLTWEANFPGVEEPRATLKRTLRQNDFVKVLRSFPAAVRPGETFEVVILVEALQDLTGTEIVVQEELPRGWTLDPIEPTATRLTPAAVRWTLELGAPGSRETIRYLATVPDGTPPGAARIVGTVQAAPFGDLDFSDTLEVLEGPPTLPGRVRLRQDVIFAQQVSGGLLADPTAFRLTNVRLEALLEPGLRLVNFFTLQNAGTVQTPSFRWRDTVTVQGRTSGGVGTRLALRFRGGEDLRAQFDRGSLQVGAIPLLPDTAVRVLTDFDVDRVTEIRVSATHTRAVADALGRFTLNLGLDEQLQMRLLSFSARLSAKIDGIFQVDDRYGPLNFDGDDDGVEETHLTLVRRQVQLRFSIDKLDVRSSSLFRPVLDDIDSDGARERIARAKLVRQEIRVRRSLENVVFQGRLLLTEADPANATLSPAQLRLETIVTRERLRFSADVTLDLKPLRFGVRLGMSVSF